MTVNQERILIVENDAVISDLIARQALKSAGYQTHVVTDGSTAIARAIQLSPDVIIVDLTLPGLSGKDLMVALTSQNVQTPVVVVGRKENEADVIQAFRLGATDYLIWPMREAEVIQVVERVLRQVRERHERERLSLQLQQTNQELQNRVRELTTIFAIGKAVTSITDQSLLFERILEGAARVTQSDLGWFLLRDENTKSFTMVAQRELPSSMQAYMNQAFDDGISSLVAMSSEPLSIHGEPLKRFKVSSLGQSVLIVPVKVQRQVIALLVVIRKQPLPYSSSDQHLLEAVADYASISLVNSRLFRTVEERAHSLQSQAELAETGEKIGNELLLKTKQELRSPLMSAQNELDQLMRDPAARWTTDQRHAIATLVEQVQCLNRIIEAIMPLPLDKPGSSPNHIHLVDVVKQAVSRYQHFAQQNNLTLVADTPNDTLTVALEARQLLQVLEGLLSNAIKYSSSGGRVTVKVEKTLENSAHIIVSDTGSGIDPALLSRLFDASFHPDRTHTQRFGGLGIGLRLAKEIINRQNGKLWVDSKPGQGTSFHFTLPLVK